MDSYAARGLSFLFWASLALFVYCLLPCMTQGFSVFPVVSGPMCACWLTMAVCLAGLNRGRQP